MWGKRAYSVPENQRCRADIKLRDGTGAQCMRRRVGGPYCKQHATLDAALRATVLVCCGGNDAYPPEHTQDCDKR